MLRYGASLATVAAFGPTAALARVAESTPLPLPQTSKPNILFMLVDNLGYGELGCYGGGVTRGAPTPRRQNR